jgi:hypothetical protein
MRYRLQSIPEFKPKEHDGLAPGPLNALIGPPGANGNLGNSVENLARVSHEAPVEQPEKPSAHIAQHGADKEKEQQHPDDTEETQEHDHKVTSEADMEKKKPEEDKEDLDRDSSADDDGNADASKQEDDQRASKDAQLQASQDQRKPVNLIHDIMVMDGASL